jgi:hypothetical protein
VDVSRSVGRCIAPRRALACVQGTSWSGTHGVLTWVVLAMRIAFLPQWQHLEDAVGTALQRSLGHIGVSFV